MTSKLNSADGGTSAALVTAANSGGGSGNAFDVVTASQTVCTFASDQAADGALSYKVNSASGVAVKLQWTGFNGANFAVRGKVRFDAIAASATSICEVLNSGGTTIATVFLSGTGKFLAQASGTNVVGGSSTPSVNTWYRFELYGTVGTTTSNGQITFKVYQGGAGDTGANTTTEFFSAASSTANLGTTNVTSVTWGKTNTSTYGTSLWLDSLAAKDTDATPWGPVTNAPPSANAGPDQTGIEPFATVTLSGAGSSDSDGTVASYSWTQTAGTTVTLTGSTTVSPSFTAPATLAGTTLTFQLTATDNLGATGTASVNVTVLPHTIWRKHSDGTLHPVIVTKP